MTALPQRHVHLALWLFVLSQTVVAKIAVKAPEDWLNSIASGSLLVIVAFLVVFHLLTDTRDDKPSQAIDFGVLGAVVVFAVLGGLVGTRFDIALLCLPLAVAYLTGLISRTDGRHIGLVYLALGVNGFVAPLVFMLFKDAFLVGEVDLVAFVTGLVGFDVTTNGARLRLEDGLRLQMIGGCSVFSNLSLAFLGYASFKAFFRLGYARRDIGLLLALALCLILMNTVRIGMMLPSVDAYEFWHHGDGAAWFGLAQMIAIAAIAMVSLPSARQPWRA